MSIDSEAQKRNLSFTDGETSPDFFDLQPHLKAAAVAIRGGLLEKFDCTAVSEESLMLIGLEQVMLERTRQDFYIVQAGEPLERPSTLLGSVLRVPGHRIRRIQELHGRHDLVDVIAAREQRMELAARMSGLDDDWPAVAPRPSFEAWYPVVKIGERSYKHFGRGTGLSAPNQALASSSSTYVHTLSALAKARANNK